MTRAYRHKARRRPRDEHRGPKHSCRLGWRAMLRWPSPPVSHAIPVPRLPDRCSALHRVLQDQYQLPKTHCIHAYPPSPKMRLTSHSQINVPVYSQTDINRGQDGEDKGCKTETKISKAIITTAITTEVGVMKILMIVPET